jgi:hypothetical protein
MNQVYIFSEQKVEGLVKSPNLLFFQWLTDKCQNMGYPSLTVNNARTSVTLSELCVNT